MCICPGVLACQKTQCDFATLGLCFGAVDDMRARIAVAIVLVFSNVSFAADVPRSYEDAKVLWIKKRDTAEYQRYATEFTQFNNHFHLDEKDGCYALGSGPVELMLIISQPDNSEFAVIEQVLSDVDNEKARCFEKSYRGVRTKRPPFLPFVLQLGMG
jgi:hypothetical protein